MRDHCFGTIQRIGTLSTRQTGQLASGYKCVKTDRNHDSRHEQRSRLREEPHVSRTGRRGGTRSAFESDCMHALAKKAPPKGAKKTSCFPLIAGVLFSAMV